MKNVSMRVLVAATGVICALGMVAGCGGKDSADAAASTGNAAQSAEDYNIKFAQCLRDAGFNVSDPSDDKDMRNEDACGPRPQRRRHRRRPPPRRRSPRRR